MGTCECEACSQSDHPSPGIVLSSEPLLRIVYLPEEIDEDGSLKPTSIAKKDLKRIAVDKNPSRGASINRIDYLDREVLLRKAKVHQAKAVQLREQAWGFEAHTHEVRSLTHDEARALCVVDRAEPDDISHAEIWGAQPGLSDSVIRKIRANLAALLKRSERII